jgi:hypothetical protein
MHHHVVVAVPDQAHEEGPRLHVGHIDVEAGLVIPGRRQAQGRQQGIGDLRGRLRRWCLRRRGLRPVRASRWAWWRRRPAAGHQAHHWDRDQWQLSRVRLPGGSRVSGRPGDLRHGKLNVNSPLLSRSRARALSRASTCAPSTRSPTVTTRPLITALRSPRRHAWTAARSPDAPAPAAGHGGTSAAGASDHAPHPPGYAPQHRQHKAQTVTERSLATPLPLATCHLPLPSNTDPVLLQTQVKTRITNRLGPLSCARTSRASQNRPQGMASTVRR